MKKNLLFIFAALFIFSAQAQNTLKLMSYNIKNANGMDNVCNFQRIANVINNIWGIERSGFFNDRGKWVKGFENQRV